MKWQARRTRAYLQPSVRQKQECFCRGFLCNRMALQVREYQPMPIQEAHWARSGAFVMSPQRSIELTLRLAELVRARPTAELGLTHGPSRPPPQRSTV
jgi:hypothetical protein